MKPTERDATPHHYSPDELHNVGVAHEHSDINVRAIVTFLIVLAVVGIVVHALMWGLFVVFENQAARNDPPPSPIGVPPTRMPATTMEAPVFGGGPAPQLLTNEPAALRQFRAQEDQQLGTYGWTDQNAGVARLPLSEAKKLILERGLPARTEAPDPRTGTRIPAYGESSSGRAVTGPPRGAGLPELSPAQEPARQPAAPRPRKGEGH